MTTVVLVLALFLILIVLGANPTVSNRVVPTGYKMPDGWQTTIAFKINPAIQFWEKTVKPAGWQGGDPIDTTTMLNVVYKTKDSQHLKENTPVNFTAAYDPDCWTGLKELINNPSSITVHYPDGSTLAFYGYLQSADPADHVVGEMPTINGVIIVTNWDPVNFIEVGPLFTPASGT